MVFGIIVLIILIAAIALYLFVNKAADGFFGKRSEENPKIRYFTAADFPDLKEEPTSFLSGDHRLNGSYYELAEHTGDFKGLVLFAHGYGAGHHSYMTEIHSLAKQGYKVFSWDHTGCVSSEGQSIHSFYQGVRDLDAALKLVSQDMRYQDLSIGLVGHSWGGYIVCHAPSLDSSDRVRAIVALSPMNDPVRSFAREVKDVTHIPEQLLIPFTKLYFLIKDGAESLETSADALNKGLIPALLFHGTEDTSVPFEISPLADSALKDNPRVRMRILRGRYHNVYQTERSEAYLRKTFGKIGELKKKAEKGSAADVEALEKAYQTIDYSLMTEEDPMILEEIYSFLEFNMEDRGRYHV